MGGRGVWPLKRSPCKQEGLSWLPHSTHKKTEARQHGVLVIPGTGEAGTGGSPVLLAWPPILVMSVQPMRDFVSKYTVDCISYVIVS